MKTVLALAVVAVCLGGTMARSKIPGYNCNSQQLRLKVDALTTQMAALTKRLGEVCPSPNLGAAQVSELRKQQEALKGQLGKLGGLQSQAVSALSRKHEALKGKVVKLGSLQSQVSALRKSHKVTQRQIRKLVNLQSQVSALAKKQGLRTMQVGFHAQYRGTTTLSQSARVTFNSVLYNQGNGFRNNIFTAPVSGMYLLYLQIEPDPRQKSGMQVNVTGRRRVLYVFANDPHTYEMASGQRVIHLSKDQQAWVMATDVGSNRLRWNTSFGGFLVQADA